MSQSSVIALEANALSASQKSDVVHYHLKNVYRGTPVLRYGLKTAIDKSPVSTRIYLSYEGLEGDECADKLHHGGRERALHQYPLEHYDYWREKYGSHNHWQAPGMGENLSSEGMTEGTVCLGDRYQWGDAIIEVSQPRSPCFKLNHRWVIDEFASNMQKISRCGWLYRVVQPGKVSVDDPLMLLEQVPNAISLRRICEMFFGDPLNRDGLLELEQQNTLSNSWMKKVVKRLETNKVEDWNARLLGVFTQG